jgi:UDP-2,3-diacylglucosamine hydrolase
MRKLYARWYRFKSGLDKGGKTHDIMDVNQDAVDETLRRFNVRRLIHGHTHRAGLHTLTIDDQPAERYVLPEWNGQEWLLVFDTGGHRQEALTEV